MVPRDIIGETQGCMHRYVRVVRTVFVIIGGWGWEIAIRALGGQSGSGGLGFERRTLHFGLDGGCGIAGVGAGGAVVIEVGTAGERGVTGIFSVRVFLGYVET